MVFLSFYLVAHHSHPSRTASSVAVSRTGIVAFSLVSSDLVAHELAGKLHGQTVRLAGEITEGVKAKAGRELRLP